MDTGDGGLRAHVVDRTTGAIELVGDPVNARQITGDDFIEGNTAISDDGRVVAFTTRMIDGDRWQ